MRVQDVMTPNPTCCERGDALQNVASQMAQGNFGGVPVVENRQSNKPIGFVTDRDITVRTVAEGKNPLEQTAGDVMSENLVTVRVDADLREAGRKMQEAQVRRLIVTNDDGGCCGILAQADLARAGVDAFTGDVVEEISEPS